VLERLGVELRVAADRGFTPATTCPSSVMRPDVTGTSPAIRPRSVDLPQPEGPTIETNSPPLISTDTS